MRLIRLGRVMKPMTRISAPHRGHTSGSVSYNRIAIVIPCHRVVNADGRLGGYGGGLWRKQRLLALEQGQARID